jgi:hypothetical protein
MFNEPATMMTGRTTAAARAGTTTRRLLRLRGYAPPPQQPDSNSQERTSLAKCENWRTVTVYLNLCIVLTANQSPD